MAIMADEPTRVEVEEALVNLCVRARREMYVIGTPEHPTPWDIRHAAIDKLLRDWEVACRA